MKNIISPEDREKFAVTNKIGLLSTVNAEGEPHITLISSIEAKGEDQLIWGQFSHGLSKINLNSNKKSGFLIMNMEKKWWRGKTLHKEVKDSGEDYDMFNNKPLFRYNSYFGIGKVHYMDLQDYSGEKSLQMKDIIKGALKGRLIKGMIKKSPDGIDKIKGLGLKLAKDIASLKFLSYIDEDGYPVLLPIIQAVAKDKSRIIIPLIKKEEEIKKIKKGAKVAIFYLNLELSSVLLQGTFSGVQKKAGVEYAIFDTEKVYNSMVPIVGYIYPYEGYKLIH